jgi:hypothetical protein
MDDPWLYLLFESKEIRSKKVGRFHLEKAKYFPDEFMLFKWTVGLPTIYYGYPFKNKD